MRGDPSTFSKNSCFIDNCVFKERDSREIIPFSLPSGKQPVKELVYKIYPYKIDSYISPATHRVMKNGVVLLLVYTVNGVYNILYDGNQRNNKTAYYISNEFATFQNGLERYELYEAGEYFVLPNADMVKDKGEIEEFVDVNGIAEICKKNNWCIDYSYK